MSNDSDLENIKPTSDQPAPQPEEQASAPSTAAADDGAILSNRRIAKNTMLLYLRTIAMTMIGIFTSRVILQTLGVSDYGINSAVGGIIAIFSIVTSSLSMAIGRYLTYELGRGDKERLKLVFSTSINVQFAIAVFVVILGLTVGFWFLNNKMNIPDGRMDAANWVLFCCIMSFAVGIVNVPYNSSIISHERMNVFAYMSILDAFFRLAIVFALYISPFDKLKTYAVLGLGISLLMRYIYYRYCKKNFEECRYKFVFDGHLIKEMTKFAGWSFFGNGAWILNTQGINILINIFFGVTLNAARGIASQVEGLVSGFVNNFMVALNPQITKLYASGDLPSMHTLVCRGARFSFFLMLFFGIPCCLETEKLLMLWLGIVPDYTVLFVRLSFVASICTVLGNTLVTAQFATGDIKRYQIVMTVVGAWVFPLTWLAFKLGGDPSWTYIVYSAVYFVLIFVRIYLVKDMIHMSWMMYVKDVLLRGTVVAIIALILPLAIYLTMQPSILRFILVWLVSLISSGAIIYWLGMDAEERAATNRMLNKVLRRK
jgi:O-antigen/teichoic acid export membrane protein